jgi:hypothetical protein
VASSLSLYRNRTGRLATLGLMIFLLAYALKCLYSIWANLRIGNIWFNDFFAIWSFAKFPITNHAPDIYDRSILDEFQESLGSTPTIHLPYPYPPSFLIADNSARADGLLCCLRIMDFWYVPLLLCRFVASRMAVVRDFSAHLRAGGDSDIRLRPNRVSHLCIDGRRVSPDHYSPGSQRGAIWTGVDQASVRDLDPDCTDLGAALAYPGCGRCDRSRAHPSQQRGVRLVDLAAVGSRSSPHTPTRLRRRCRNTCRRSSQT